MQAYENGGHAYHATMPTDSLVRFRDTLLEIEELGFETASLRQRELGSKVRDLLASKGIRSIAADGFTAPGVVVSYTSDADIKSGKKFAEVGVQIAAGVPLMCDEPEDFQTFRLGLFGLEKLKNVDGAVARLEEALDNVLG
jgi:aspartate aminotransferase-like enzyme